MKDRVDNWSAYLSDVREVNELSEPISLHARTGQPLGDEPFVAMFEKVRVETCCPRGQVGRLPICRNRYTVPEFIA
jgi:hypothetical protein